MTYSLPNSRKSNFATEPVLAKIREYGHDDVQVVWVIIAPEEQQVYVYTSPTQVRILTIDDTLAEEQLLPGFHLPLVRLFQRVAATRVMPTS